MCELSMLWHVEYTVGVMVNDSKQFRISRGLRESFTINLKRATVAASSRPVTTARNFPGSCRGGVLSCPVKRPPKCPWWLNFMPVSRDCRGSGHGNRVWIIFIIPTVAIWSNKCLWPKSPKRSVHRAMSTPAPRSSDTGASSMQLSVSTPIKSVTP